MALTINVNGYHTVNANGTKTSEAAADSAENIKRADGVNDAGKRKKRAQIFGGDLNLANDPIERRRKEAQEQAWNVVKTAWENERSIDDSMQARSDHYDKMERLKREALDSVSDIEDDAAFLKELYDVADDSKEQQDLEVLKKEQDFKNKVTFEPLTKEELDRLEELRKSPLTEYQTRALELNDRAGVLKKQIRDYDRQMKDDTADLRSIAKERLKSNPILEAKQAAEAIMEAANEEIKGMLVQEAVDHVDEKMEEAEKKAEASEEKKEKKEDQREELELKRAMQEVMIEQTKEAVEKAKAVERRNEAPDIEIQEMIDIAQGQKVSKEIGQSLDDIKNSMKVLEADLKGIKVDEEV